MTPPCVKSRDVSLCKKAFPIIPNSSAWVRLIFERVKNIIVRFLEFFFFSITSVELRYLGFVQFQV